ncbi:hypothetical protein EJB05_01047, partial [Eragrostis curvula]
MAGCSSLTSPAALAAPHPPPPCHFRPRTRAWRNRASPVPTTCHHQFQAPTNRYYQSSATTSRSSAESGQSTTTTGNSSKPSSRKKVTLKLMYLEINTWVWEVQQHGGGEARPLRVLVDPIAAGNLDFGMPWLYDGAKKHPSVRAMGVDDLLATTGQPDVLLLTSGLDDHCHARTLARLSAMEPDLPVVAAPSAERVLAALPAPSFRRVTYLAPGQSAAVDDRFHLLAAPGPVQRGFSRNPPNYGPLQKRPENAYVLFAAAGDGNDDGDGTTGGGEGLIYYEPHCVYDRRFLGRKNRVRAKVVITPVVKQLLPGNLAVVSGQEDAVKLARLLDARHVVPMNNGDLDAGGLLAGVISTRGTAESFKAMMAESLPEVRVHDATPGVPLCLDL